MTYMGDDQRTLTKVFVGGLAWKTPKEAVRDHFQRYGEILEAVVISDKLTGKSKGYGFVTFKDAEAAKKACEDPTPMINGRRANCNLASLGARRDRSSSTPPQSGSAAAPSPRLCTPSLQWHYPNGTPFPQNQRYGAPYHPYGYSPIYIADVGYNRKLSYSGSYINEHFSQTQMYVSQGMVTPDPVMPVYPFYQYFPHQSQAMGVPAYISRPPLAAFIPKQPTHSMPSHPSGGLKEEVKVQQEIDRSATRLRETNSSSL